MRKLATVMKYCGLMMTGLVALLASQVTQAETGWCQSTSGTQNYLFNYTQTFTDPSQNKANTTVENAYTWSLGGTYAIQCDCTTRPATLFKAEVPSTLTFNHTSGGESFYNVNDYLAVATSISILNQGYVPTPFINVSNKNNNGAVGCTSVSTGASSGGKGQISLYFIRPFVGQVTIPLTTVVNLYGTTISGSYSTVPLARVQMQGTVTVPQNCTINAGQIINVDFGDIQTTAISTKGTSTVAEKQVNATLQCTNISSGVKVTLSFKGANDSNDNTALATSNKDIGIRVKNSNRTIVTPNKDELPVTMDYSSQKGTSTMYLTPINTSGKVPATGSFNAVATLNAEMQ